MVHDQDTTVVFISGLLPERSPSVVEALTEALGNRLRLITGSNDIWCRDYMPIQLATDRFIQFRYDPDYLKPREHAHLRTDDAASLLGFTHNCMRSDLVIDGGNIVRWIDAVILCEKVFKENRRHEPSRLQDALRRVLELDRLVVIPQEPGDDIGHSDGMVRFVSHDTVLVNDYTDSNPAFGVRVEQSLARHGLKTIPFPYCPTDQPGRDPGIASAVGVYINFLQIDGMVLCPTFELEADERAIRLLEQVFPRQRIIPVDCRELATDGGVLNCVTWNIHIDAE